MIEPQAFKQSMESKEFEKELTSTALDWYTPQGENFYQVFGERSPDIDGMIAYGGELSSDNLLEAYARGIFPWYDEPPVLWFSPFWRAVFLDEFKVSKSFAKFLKNHSYDIKFDTRFVEVMKNCAKIKRKDQNGTWINEEMIRAYTQLHELGVAHSVEVFQADKLVGGLYGISLGKAFFGESMFSLEKNTSKLALHTLYLYLKKLDFHFIDCQLPTEHLSSLGAQKINRLDFIKKLNQSNSFSTQVGKWHY